MENSRLYYSSKLFIGTESRKIVFELFTVIDKNMRSFKFFSLATIAATVASFTLMTVLHISRIRQ